MAKGKVKRNIKDREALRAHMKAIRPAQPYLRHGLYSPLSPAERAKAEARLYRKHPHLRRQVDQGRVRSLAHLDALLEQAWAFFSTPGRQIASASSRGKTTWDPGLARLLQLEELRLKLARELLVTPRSRQEIPVDDRAEVAEAMKALRKAMAPPKEVAAHEG